MTTPTHGFTKLGHAVHAKTTDHLKGENAYQRFNRRAAIKITQAIGSMTCAWIFCLLALCSLPAVLSAFSVFSGVFPTFLIKASVIALIAWIAQTFIQLVALSIIIVGQNIQAEASDARAAKTFEDAEETKSNVLLAIDRLDTETQGGLQVILEAIKKKK